MRKPPWLGVCGLVAALVGAGVVTEAGARTPSVLASPGLSRSNCVWHATLSGPPSKSLLAILGVLRKPAAPGSVPSTIVSRFTRPIERLIGQEVYVNYLRLARMFDGVAYYIVPIRYDGCGQINLSGDAIWLFSATGGGGGGNAALIERGMWVGTSGPGIPGDPHSGTVQMVVPDGVASATISYPAGPANGFKPKIVSPPVTIEATAVGNVLVFNVPRSSGGGQIVHPTSMVWRNAAGTVIRRFRGRL
jgi:hypothetical protein